MTRSTFLLGLGSRRASLYTWTMATVTDALLSYFVTKGRIITDLEEGKRDIVYSAINSFRKAFVSPLASFDFVPVLQTQPRRRTSTYAISQESFWSDWRHISTAPQAKFLLKIRLKLPEMGICVIDTSGFPIRETIAVKTHRLRETHPFPLVPHIFDYLSVRK